MAWLSGEQVLPCAALAFRAGYHFIALLHYSDDAKPAGWFYQEEANKEFAWRIRYSIALYITMSCLCRRYFTTASGMLLFDVINSLSNNAFEILVQSYKPTTQSFCVVDFFFIFPCFFCKKRRKIQNPIGKNPINPEAKALKQKATRGQKSAEWHQRGNRKPGNPRPEISGMASAGESEARRPEVGNQRNGISGGIRGTGI